MKRIAFLTLFSMFALCWDASAQHGDKVKDREVPEAVRAAFDNEFNGAMMVNWKMDEGKYKAMFTRNLKKGFAKFTPSGELVAKGEKINTSELPTLVSDALKTNYAQREIDEAYSVEKQGKIHYMVKLEGEPKTVLLYDAEGNLVKDKKK